MNNTSNSREVHLYFIYRGEKKKKQRFQYNVRHKIKTMRNKREAINPQND